MTPAAQLQRVSDQQIAVLKKDADEARLALEKIRTPRNISDWDIWNISHAMNKFKDVQFDVSTKLNNNEAGSLLCGTRLTGHCCWLRQRRRERRIKCHIQKSPLPACSCPWQRAWRMVCSIFVLIMRKAILHLTDPLICDTVDSQ